MVFKKLTPTSAAIFRGRVNSVISAGGRTDIPIPDDDVICNGCNCNIAATESKEGYLIYLSKTDLKNNHSYDIFCKDCTNRYFPKAQLVDSMNNIIVSGK